MYIWGGVFFPTVGVSHSVTQATLEVRPAKLSSLEYQFEVVMKDHLDGE